jgi:hypothetical protein
MLTFDEETHTYTLDGDTYTSVTTLLSTWFKPFDKDVALKSVRKNNVAQYESMTDKEIMDQWEKDGELAAKLGTELHKKIECYLSGDLSVTGGADFAHFLSFIQDCPLKIKSVEWRLFDRCTKLAGTIDCVSENKDGTYDIYDWKRTKNVNRGSGSCQHPLLRHIPSTGYWKFTLQVNLYRYLLETNGYPVKNMFILVFHPENLNYIKYKITHVDLTKVLKQKE